MRLQNAASSSLAMEIKEFADWLLQLGDGTIKPIDDDDSIIEVPSDLLVRESDNPLLELVNFSYPNVVANLENHEYFEQRALLAPTLESVEEVNNSMLPMIPREETKYLSYDTLFRVPIMLIRNLDQSAGLCNGTRLMVTALTPYNGFEFNEGEQATTLMHKEALIVAELYCCNIGLFVGFN
ncbi:uncharacterized protein LOC130740306 [Lotus japonicus]|uniref:uncharacterized protein LOC130740306 n=1 Tax=Lotus japonicus TaxID=34305 RepID=UPI00258E8FB4|nr:uncharacterized protein LOC130740306 [Lotus japonicus]